MFILLSIVFILVFFIYMLFMLMFYKKLMDLESMSSYECGFDPKSLTRQSFSYRFFLISILFMIFDVEISLLLPIPYLNYIMESMWLFILFISILVLGLLYEYYCGSLEWLNNFVSKI